MSALTIKRCSINIPVLVGDVLRLPTFWHTMDSSGHFDPNVLNGHFAIAHVHDDSHVIMSWHDSIILYQQDGHWSMPDWDGLPGNIKMDIMETYHRYGVVPGDSLPWEGKDTELWTMTVLGSL